MDNNTFGERLFQLRTKRGLSRQKVAEALGISRQSLEYYEKGARKPDIEVLAMLAKHYEVSADYLLGFTDAATDDTDLRKVCDYTGLDADAAACICKVAYPDKESFKTLNMILKSPDFFELVTIATEYEKRNKERAERIKTYINEYNVISNPKESIIEQFAGHFLKELNETDYLELKKLVGENGALYLITDYIYNHCPEMQTAFDSSAVDLQTFRAQRVVEPLLQSLSLENDTSPSFQTVNFYDFMNQVSMRIGFTLLDEIMKEREKQKKQEPEEGAEE